MQRLLQAQETLSTRKRGVLTGALQLPRTGLERSRPRGGRFA
jgi:hypothetical protein